MKSKLLILLFATLIFGQTYSEGELLSKDLFVVAGSATTVLFGSREGVSWCTGIDMPVSQQVWQHIQGVSLLSGDNADRERRVVLAAPASFLARLVTDEPATLSFLSAPYAEAEEEMLLFSHTFTVAPSLTNLSFDSYGGVYEGGHYWLAAYDAGLVEVADTGVVAFHIPDSSQPVSASQFSLLTQLPEEQRILGVDGYNGQLVLFSEKMLWHYTLSTHSWSSHALSDTTLSLRSVQFSEQGDTLFCLVDDTLGSSQIVRFDRLTNSSSTVVTQAGMYQFSRGAGNRLYILFGDKGALMVRDGITGSEIQTNIENRILNTNISTSHVRRQVVTFGQGDSMALSLSTDAGGLYSWDELSADSIKTPFMYLYKARPLKGNLEHVLAVPSILTRSGTFITFEYALDEETEVTIDMFNSNFEFLCRITDHALRPAASSLSDGRSTNRSEDRWDGTVDNEGGRMAPPGVYLYRITTETGEKRFGKCVLAKN